MAYETIQLEMHGSICVLTLNRPDRLNALTVQTAQDFNAAVHEALERGARAIVLTGSGRAFCAGGDLREMQEMASSDGRVEAFFDEP
ncbi:MAG TPA: enoyl-CoA hydratase/isomerase family protein, partial [Pyrinomonadaceae bacterium]